MINKLTDIAAVFDALSNETRLQIFRILVEHSKDGITPTEISSLMNDFPRNTLSFHLSLMVNVGLCSSEKQGKQIFSGTIDKVEDISAIISYGVMSTPAVVIDGKVAFVGGVPSKEQVESWFSSSACSCSCCG